MRRLLIPLLLLATAATPAMAHTPTPGLVGFVSAVPHVATEPAQLLLLVGLSLWNGQSSARTSARLLGVTLLALVFGAAVGIVERPNVLFLPTAALGLACLFGLASGLRLSLPLRLHLAITVVSALLAGIFSAPDPGPLPAVLASGTGALGGALLFASLIFVITRWCADSARPQPFGVGIRVAGSWIAAASMMAGALALHQL